MIAFLTILHGLVAMALIGATTHQGLAVWRRGTAAAPQWFVNRFRAVSAVRFANAVVVLYVLTFVLGAYLYPQYILDVKGSLADSGQKLAIGVFQLKEHLAVIALGLLPVYWHYWRQVPLTEGGATRKYLTTFLLVTVWWNLVIGHVLNNLRGLT